MFPLILLRRTIRRSGRPLFLRRGGYNCWRLCSALGPGFDCPQYTKLSLVGLTRRVRLRTITTSSLPHLELMPDSFQLGVQLRFLCRRSFRGAIALSFAALTASRTCCLLMELPLLPFTNERLGLKVRHVLFPVRLRCRSVRFRSGQPCPGRSASPKFVRRGSAFSM